VQKGEEGLLGPLPVGHPALHLMIDPPSALIIGMKRAPQRPGHMGIKRIKAVERNRFESSYATRFNRSVGLYFGWRP
jgi:hypothetical protein